MKHKTILLFLFAGLTLTSYGQEEKHFTQFSFNKLVFNPAYAGNADVMAFTAMYRNQWTTIAGAPITFNLNMHTPITQGRGGIGLSIISDQVGLFQKMQVDGAYNYKIPVFGNSILSMGVSAGVHINSMQWQDADAFDAGDGSIPDVEGSVVKPNFGVGFFLSSETYFIGLSAPRLLRSPIYMEQEGSLLSKRPYYFMSGLVLPLNRTVKLKPAALISLIPNAPFEADFSLSALFIDKLWIGGAYRLGDSFGGMMQYDITNQLQMGVSFDFTVSDLRKFTGQTMEFMLRYNMEYQSSDVRNIRYF